MIRTTILFTLLFISFSIWGQGGRDEHIDPFEDPLVIFDPAANCNFRAIFETLPSNQFPVVDKIPFEVPAGTFATTINKDCLAEEEIIYNIIDYGGCTSDGGGVLGSVSNILRIKFGNRILIENIPFDLYPQTIRNSFKLSDYDFISELSTPQTYPLTIEFCTIRQGSSGPYNPYSPSIPTIVNCEPLTTKSILVLGDGDRFILDKESPISSAGTSNCDNVPPILRNVGVCNPLESEQDPVVVTYEFTESKVTDSNLQLKGGIKGQGKSDWFNAFPITLSLEATYTYNYSTISEEILSREHRLTLDPPDGECRYGAVNLSGKTIETVPVEVQCNELVPYGDPLILFSITNFNLIACEGFTPNDASCPDGNCPPEILTSPSGSNFTDGSVLVNKNIEPCTYDVSATECENNEYHEFYTWVLPNGNTREGAYLVDVPAGLYILQVSTECNEYYELEVNVCPDLTYGDWSYDDGVNLICAPVSCNADECESSYNTTTCVVPEASEWEYDEISGQICHRIVCPEGEACEEGFTPVTVCVEAEYSDWSYDESAQKFSRTISCPEGSDCSEVFRPIEVCLDATFGEWNFDDFQGICERDVLLNEEPSGYTDTSEPTYRYEYDDFFDECIRYTICGGSEVEEVREDPEYGDWAVEEDFFDGAICRREVICFGSSENQNDWEDNINEDPEIVWRYDEFTEDCVGYVFCDGSSDWEEEGEVVGEVVFLNGSFNRIGPSCNAEISCEYNNELYTTGYDYESTPEDEWSIGVFNGFYECLIEYRCEEFNYSEYFPLPSVIQVINQEGTLCRITCQTNISIYLDVPCDDLEGILGDDGNISLRTAQEVNDYNQIILQRGVKDEPLLSPNPVTNALSISYIPLLAEQGFIQVFNAGGQEVINRPIGNELTRIDLDMGKFPSGVYTVRLVDKDYKQVYVERIVKSGSY